MAVPVLKFVRNHPEAIMPKRGTEFSVGMDLTVVDVHPDFKKNYPDRTTQKSGETILYDTGLIVIPPEGYYTEIHERSSFHRCGRKLANNVGIIDEDYRGPLYVAVINYQLNDVPLLHQDSNPKARTGFQLIMRKAIYPEIWKVEQADETERGSGGFGSTTPTK